MTVTIPADAAPVEQCPAIVEDVSQRWWAIGILEMLLALRPAINGIHGGCMVCLVHFAERANAALIQQGVPYRYEVKPQLGKPGLATVDIVQIEPLPPVEQLSTEAISLSLTGEMPV